MVPTSKSYYYSYDYYSCSYYYC